MTLHILTDGRVATLAASLATTACINNQSS